MARRPATFASKIKRHLRREILEDKAGEFQLLLERQAACASLGGPEAVLKAIADVARPNCEKGPVLRALIFEAQKVRRLAIVMDILLLSFAPSINRKLRRAGKSANREDIEQECILGLFEAVQMLPLRTTKNDQLASALCAGIHRAYLAFKRRERQQEITIEQIIQKVGPLGPEGLGACRCRKSVRLRFFSDEVSGAKRKLRCMLHDKIDEVVCLADWTAMAIDGEPAKQVARRLYGPTCDEELVRCAARIRRRKIRVGQRISRALAKDKEALMAAFVTDS